MINKIDESPACTCHIDYTSCTNENCIEYAKCLDVVEESMSPSEATAAIVEIGIDQTKAKQHVDAMIDTGFING
jgi:hypothetical protein